jgi:hypothetical protein
MWLFPYTALTLAYDGPDGPSGGTSDPRALVAPLGFDHLSEIAELRFTFNVERDGVLKASRSWTWRPAEGTVSRGAGADALTFKFGAPKTDDERKADAQFINDSFWLAPQMHLGWAGPEVAVTDGGMVARPIPAGGATTVPASTVREITVTYPASGGGYTPGDAYDLFLDSEGRIVAWNYREGNAPTPTMTTTFDGYVPVGPLQIAAEHRDAAGSFRLYFTDLQATPRQAP